MGTKAGEAAMNPRAQAVIEEIKAVLEEAGKIRQTARSVQVQVRTSWDEEPRSEMVTEPLDEDVHRANMLLLSAVAKYAPPHSPYRAEAQKALDATGSFSDHKRHQ